MADTIANELLALSHEVQRLCPCHRNPESFHEAKSEIVWKLKKLAVGGYTQFKDQNRKKYGPAWERHKELVLKELGK